MRFLKTDAENSFNIKLGFSVIQNVAQLQRLIRTVTLW